MRREIAFSLVMALTAGCGRHPTDSVTIARDPYPDARTFLSSIKHYPYVASSGRSTRIIDGARKLRRCMSKAEVSAVLGSPDYSETDYGPKGPSEHWLGSNWMFYVSKQSDMVNLKDPRMEVFFDTSGRATWIVPAGLRGARELGTPDRSASSGAACHEQ